MPPSSSSLPPLILLDGGLGTTLADYHRCIFDDSTPLWSSQLLITDPETLLACQKGFAKAGADVISSSTYQASFEGFARSGIPEVEAAKLMRDGVAIARTSFGGKKGKVALSLGAYGATMLPSQEYTGDYDEEHRSVEQLQDWHLKRLRVFAECWAEIDYVAFETLPRIEEIHAVRHAIARLDVRGPKKQWWLSCVFPGDANTVPDGSDIEEVVEAALAGAEARPTAVGINCTKVGKVEMLIEEFEKEIHRLELKGSIGLVVYPDGTNGEVYNTETKVWEMKTAGSSSMEWDEQIFSVVQKARERQVWNHILVGGCCKTTPEDIGKLRKRIDAL